jgi:plastocyanin
MIDQLWNSVIEFSAQFVIPDWGSLVGLIPLLLAGLVVLFLTWTIYRFATAGPKRRGRHRLEPIPPEGTHMPGPSFAPLLGAFGAFMMVFGLVVGGMWLWVGVAVLAVTMLYWGREALRDYDRVQVADQAAGSTAMIPAGMLPTPEGKPPAGVHIPAPSFRPLLVAISMTLLVAGLVVGGWALLFGAIAVVITGLGWLRDARREYTAAERADETGHLDAGGAPSWPVTTFAVLAVILAGGLLLSSGLLPNSNSGETAAASGAPADGGSAGGAGGGSSTPAPSLPNADVTLTAENVAYTETSITAAAGQPFTIGFVNKDAGVPHNVAIKDASGKELFQGAIITGPAATVYDIPPLPAGTYTFVCSVHPNMTGTLTIQ